MALAVRAIGPYRGASGYDRVTREFARGLLGLGVRLQLVDVEGWSAPLPSPGALEGHSAHLDADVAAHFTMPDRCRPEPGVPNANYTEFEATRIPPDWVERAREHDRIILPHDGCRDAWSDSGVPTAKLRVCGQGVDARFFAEPAPPLELGDAAGRPVGSYRRRFLCVGELRPRKNHLGLLRTWLRATTRDDDAILVLKCLAPPQLAQQFSQDVERMQESVGRRFADAAPVRLANVLLDDRDMRALYRSATHYISMSHGEGWDLPMMEAAAAGLSLLAPDHSAYRLYLRESDADWIPSAEVDVRLEGRAGSEDLVYFRGLRWWEPDEAAAAEIIARVIASDERRAAPTQRISSDFTWAQASRRLLDVLEELR